MTAGEKPTTRLTLPRSRRLAHDREYEAVFAAKVRAMAGPLTVFSVPNEKGFCRLGLSIGKRVGGAVMRNRLKRMLREAFRLTKAQHSAEHPFFDFVISAREHKPAKLSEYQAWLLEAIGKSDASWKRRSEKQKGDAS